MKGTMTDPNVSHQSVNFYEFYEVDLNYTYDFNVTEFHVDGKTIPCKPISISDVINITVCVFYAVVFLLAIPGNLIVGFVIGSNRQSISPSEVYLFHLMVADLLLALTLPFYATSVVHGWLFGNTMCKLVSLVKEASFYTSILFLVCISMDRYMVIVWAMEARKAQRRLCSWVVCLAVWFLGILLSLPALYNEAFTPKHSETELCAERFNTESSDEWRLATRIMRHLLGFFLPLAIMITCYSITIARLLRTRGFQRQKAMRIIVAVVVAFLLCWTPFHMATIVDTLMRAKLLENDCSKHNIVDLAMFATQSLGLLHCCVNPVLYAFVGEKFRKKFMQLLYKSGMLERSSVSRSTRSSSQSSEAMSNFL
ncbi:C-X-C chemokine receptor type 2 [Pygocentrus nattereri]|uniref:G-protein coupled receptors family 1 profile domain-containing protein n=1 Tax=Pygocentrus nattereri TaxID=42514 RepID=A0AAR2L8T6_PYGNA|nr:C-X-C chemokine receptor type 2 [Pygocentrus nattereri]